MLRTSAVIFWFLMGLCQANKLPDYFIPCNAKDPNLGKCIEDRANDVLPTLIKGDEALGLPPFFPFTVDLTVSPENTYTFNLKGGKVEVFEGVQYQESKFDLKKVEANGILYFPKLVITGPYEIDGKFLNTPVKGNGLATITLDDVSLNETNPFNLYKKNGIDYMKLLETTATYKIGHSSYSFAQDEQATELNKVVNEQSEIFTEGIAPSLTKTIVDLSSKAIRAVNNYSTFSEIFLP